jgi:hypothetical protein
MPVDQPLVDRCRQIIAKHIAEGRLDKKGISAETFRHVPIFDRPDRHHRKIPQSPTGDLKRDRGIRQRGLKTRYDYLKIQRSYAPTKAMRTCSMFTIKSLVKTDDKGDYIEVKQKGTTERRRHYLEDPDKVPDMVLKSNEYGSSISGLQTCDNPFCVMCSRGRAMDRAERIDRVLNRTARGYSRFFVTLTIERQADARRAVQDIQRRWRAVQKALQYRYKGRKLAFSRAVDVTFRPDWIKVGKCYHVHLHTIIIIDGKVDRLEIEGHILKAWGSGGDYTIKTSESGQDVQEVIDERRLAKYVAKMGGLGLELASSQTKRGKGQSLSLPQLLESIEGGNVSHRRVYQEFLEMMKGVRTMSFSKAWTEIEKALDAEDTEQGVEESQKASRYDFEAVVPPHWWSAVIAVQGLLCQALYHHRQVKHDHLHCKRLRRLLSLDVPEARCHYLELWMNGTLKDWHLDAVTPCLE